MNLKNYVLKILKKLKKLEMKSINKKMNVKKT